VDRALHLLDVVALVTDLPDEGLERGQVGTIVEALGPDVYEVEFSDNQGHTYASVPIPQTCLLLLRHEPVQTP
jgi:Domain of unknown function (DUF4926)